MSDHILISLYFESEKQPQFYLTTTLQMYLQELQVESQISGSLESLNRSPSKRSRRSVRGPVPGLWTGRPLDKAARA
jgi:hypothetical protein